MNKSWKVVLAFIVVFAAGSAVGWVFTLHYAAPKAEPAARELTPPEEFGTQLLQRWIRSKQLGLTPAQNQKIRPIISDTAEDLRRLRRENLHSTELILEHMQDEVAAVLTPEQRDRFDNLILYQRGLMAKFLENQQRLQMKQQRQQQAAAP